MSAVMGWDELERAAERVVKLLRPVDGTPTLVSIDYDFLSGPVRPMPDDPPSLRSARMAAVHWMGDETLDASQSRAWWQERSDQARTRGFHLREIVDAHGAPTVQAAGERLGGIKTPSGAVMAAESHLWGAVLVRALHLASGGRPVQITHIDRHHDLGYINPGEQDTPEQARRLLDEGITCDNWLWAVLQRGWATQVQMVLADATWYDEWKLYPPQAPVSITDHVERVRWSQWHPPMRADAMLVVRSAPWSPPWLDAEFEPLVQHLDTDPVWLDELDGLPRMGSLCARESR